MKIVLTFLVLLAATFSEAQVRTVTRTVQRFGDLEKKLSDAGSSSERTNYLTDDFEERLCAQPGTPVPRSDWFATPGQQLTFRQQAVHDYGDIAIYSALASDSNANFMIVDAWKKEGDNWKLSVRYRCPASGPSPKGSLPKRY
ncbi:MAG: hypothetical protein ACXVZX_04795 [Terriglobales bacterium]